MAKVGKKPGLQCVGITEPEIRKVVRQRFPALNPTNFAPTSCPDEDYNCIAWAVGETDKWWWPVGKGYWPPGVDRQRTLEAFQAAFATKGYSVCDDVRHEDGFEKVVIYAQNGAPTHAARQIGRNKWTSKLGPFADISHNTIGGIEGKEYGTKACVMKRPHPK